VVDYFAAFLFSEPLTYDAKLPGSESAIDADEYYRLFAEDVDGSGTDLIPFLRDRFTEACVKQSAWWILDFPAPSEEAPRDLAEYRKLGLGDVTLRPFAREQILDWQRDERGNLLWLVAHEMCTIKDAPGADRLIQERWWILDRETVTLYGVEYDKNRPPNDHDTIEKLYVRSHPCGRVPAVQLELPKGLWIANRVADAQIEHFRLTAANSWNIKQTCYSMPVFKLQSNGEGHIPPTMGAGYFIAIGTEESADWIAPPTSHLDTVGQEIRYQKDELFRIVHQMSLGVDNNAATVGRSAASKIADAEAIRVILRSYGEEVREALEDTLDLVSMARGNRLEWAVEGLESFNSLDPEILIDLLERALAIGIPSKAFKVEAKSRAAEALLPGLGSEDQKVIREEIESGVDEEDEKESHEHEVGLSLAHAAAMAANGGTDEAAAGSRAGEDSATDARSGGGAPVAATAKNQASKSRRNRGRRRRAAPSDSV
jgi:hypothetical protein